jgi:AcrR family transcriptional regulator
MTSAPVQRRPGGRSARVRAAVIEATLDELTATGYAGLSIARVAARAGVNKTSVYRRWPNKGLLLADALLAGSADLDPPDTGALGTDLYALMATAPPATKPEARLARAVAITRALDAAGSDPDVVAARDALWQRRLRLVRAAVARAEARGEIRSGIDPDLVLDVLFGAFHTRVVARGEPFTPQFAADLLQLVLR